MVPKTAFTNEQLANNGNVTASEFVRNGMKAEFNIKRPKYGMKGYYMPETNLKDGVYKIDSCAIPIKDREDHFLDLEVKKHAWVPGPKYNPYPNWCELPKHAPTPLKFRGRFSLVPKLTMTDEVLKVQKKKNVPGPVYKVQEFVGNTKQFLTK